ncbi:MAG: hypothetical protein OEO83_19290 [Alphaproteobacteria bacterium]|nr:hypothetical protein [Alphaproteobacteria bacterium]
MAEIPMGSPDDAAGAPWAAVNSGTIHAPVPPQVLRRDLVQAMLSGETHLWTA